MLATVSPRRRVPTILSVYRPVEEYWETCAPGQQFGPDGERVFPPLDAYLIHLLLERLPEPPVLIDLAAESTGGAGTVLGLLHPRVQRVVTGWRSETPFTGKALTALAACRRRHGSSTNLEVRPEAELLADTSGAQRAVVLVDARARERDALAEVVTNRWDAQSGALILLLGLGDVGACPALETLLQLCPAGGARRFRLARALAEALSASTLGIVAPADDDGAADALGRVGQLFATNYPFVHLLRDAQQQSLEAAQLDGDAMKSHPSAWLLNHELQKSKRQANEAREQAEQVGRQLGDVMQQRDALRHNLESIQRSLAYRLARRLSGCRTWLARMCRLRHQGQSR